MPLTNSGAEDCFIGGLLVDSWYAAFHSGTTIPTAANELSGSDLPRIEIEDGEWTIADNVATLNLEQDPANPSVDIGTAGTIGFWSAANGGTLKAWARIIDQNGNEITLTIVAGSDVSLPMNGTTVTIPLA